MWQSSDETTHKKTAIHKGHIKKTVVTNLKLIAVSREGLADTEFKSIGLPHPFQDPRVATQVSLLGT